MFGCVVFCFYFRLSLSAYSPNNNNFYLNADYENVQYCLVSAMYRDFLLKISSCCCFSFFFVLKCTFAFIWCFVGLLKFFFCECVWDLFVSFFLNIWFLPVALQLIYGSSTIFSTQTFSRLLSVVWLLDYRLWFCVHYFLDCCLSLLCVCFFLHFIFSLLLSPPI